jgi:hypothetical protein
MPDERDVRAFDERAATYESGTLGQMIIQAVTAVN